MWKQGVRRLGHSSSVLVMLASLVAVPALAQPADIAPGQDPEAIFATINDTEITVGEYAQALRRAARNSFYHGQPPDGDMAGFQREVADTLVMRELMAEEARRRGIAPDDGAIEQRLDRLAEQGAPDEVLSAERLRLERQSLVEQLEARVQDVPPPEEAEVRAFYEANPELFTEPAKLRLSVILLRVMPEDGAAVWQAAKEEAEGILERLENGADFAELARIHSADGSADQGGDMGYVHQGMLAPEIEEAAAEMQPGEISEPIQVLEGVALVRFEDRREPTLQDFTQVAERAEGLLQRERAEEALATLRDTLHEAADVELREALLEPDGGSVQGSDQG